jgi:hypothetical protein
MENGVVFQNKNKSNKLRLLVIMVLITVAACSATSIRIYQLRVDKVQESELRKIRLLSWEKSKYKDLNGIELAHNSEQEAPFSCSRTRDVAALMRKLAELEAELAHCRGRE